MYFYGNLFVEYKIHIHGFDSKFTFRFLFDSGNVQTTTNNAWK